MSCSKTLVPSIEELIDIFPKWEKNIRSGDFKVYRNSAGLLVAEWPNTAIFGPSYFDIGFVVIFLGSISHRSDIRIVSGIMSLSIIFPSEN